MAVNKFLLQAGDRYYTVGADNATGELVPLMTSNSQNGIVLTDSNGDAPFRAFDKTPSTYWFAGGTPNWLQVKFPRPKKVNKYSIYRGNSYAPSEWTILGSNDGAAWSILHTGSDWGSLNNSYKYYTLTSNNYYYYYRINITNTLGNVAIFLYEFQIYEDPSVGEVFSFDVIDENTYKNYGVNKAGVIDLQVVRPYVNHSIKNSSPLGTGKVFKTSTYPSKYKIKSVSIE